MENLHGRMHVFVPSCLKFTRKHKNMYVFISLGASFDPHYIIMEKGSIY